MNGKQIGLGAVLVAFLALTAYAFAQHGLSGLIDLLMANSATVLVTTDLTIALTMICVWMWFDARGRGTSALPYILITLAFGSAGPLLYLIRRFSAEPVHSVHASAQ